MKLTKYLKFLLITLLLTSTNVIECEENKEDEKKEEQIFIKVGDIIRLEHEELTKHEKGQSVYLQWGHQPHASIESGNESLWKVIPFSAREGSYLRGSVKDKHYDDEYRQNLGWTVTKDEPKHSVLEHENMQGYNEIDNRLFFMLQPLEEGDKRFLYIAFQEAQITKNRQKKVILEYENKDRKDSRFLIFDVINREGHNIDIISNDVIRLGTFVQSYDWGGDLQFYSLHSHNHEISPRKYEVTGFNLYHRDAGDHWKIKIVEKFILDLVKQRIGCCC